MEALADRGYLVTATPEPVAPNQISGAAAAQLVFCFGVVVVALLTAKHINVTGGKTGTETSTRVEYGADGSPVVTIDEKVSYGISGGLATFLGKLVPTGSWLA